MNKKDLLALYLNGAVFSLIFTNVNMKTLYKLLLIIIIIIANLSGNGIIWSFYFPANNFIWEPF